MPKYKILKLRADKIFDFGFMSQKEINDYTVFYQVDLDKKAIYGAVVEEQLLMENCALFDQFQIVLAKEESEESIREWLLPELVIVDFTNIYKEMTDIPEDFVEKLITNGFIMNYMTREVHMLPFDKSGNMSRKCRLSFINSERLDVMNERLNLGIDFSKIPLKLSKYYAYRGLYLSTAKRIQKELLKITPETLIIINDNQDKEYYSYMPNVYIEEGISDEHNRSHISFETKKVTKEEIMVPFDGQGIISPIYADCINEILEDDSINSFQIRLPFSKGMLHRVDFHAFLREFDSVYEADAYIIKDAFGIERDLKLANIIMTKSMFKCFDWIKEFSRNEKDPMKFYCDALDKYQHALYVSSTDLPYGNSKVTHLSYQLLNTLELSKEQFQSLIGKQLEYIHNPIRYIEMTQGQYVDEEEDGSCNFSNWQRAFLMNPSFGNLIYVKTQLKNIQAALMTKLVLGKLVVKGQMRYMTRDLPFMLVNLIQNEQIRKELQNFKIYNYRFFLPQGNQGQNEMGLDYDTYCGFFRSPHLSRNEQGLLVPMIDNKRFSQKYHNECKVINKYLGHLTGVVMFGNESLEPMALGGADFDGDLVSMIMDSDVVNAIKAGVYTENKERPLDIQRKKEIPYIKIPSLPARDEVVPRLIPYAQIKNIFSNKIGLISNAAIAIGQFEYGNKKSADIDVKCSHCTILTGLEIDAVKNGVHPDLSLLKNSDLVKCNYLEFKKAFEKLKKSSGYHFNQLWAEKKDEEYTLGLKGTNNTIKYIEEDGTCINKLPIIFMENLNPKLNIPDVKEKKYFDFPGIVADKQKEKVFKEQCNMIFDSYKYYSDLFTFIQKETGGVDYSEANIKKLLYKQYDSEYVKKIVAEDLPYLYEQIAGKINSYADFKLLEQKINLNRWHLMNEDDKRNFLCEVLDVESLEGDKWSTVLKPYNHSYKILWYIVQKLGSGLKPEYCSIKNKFNEFQSKSYQMYPYVSKQADVMLRNYLENKESGIATRLYGICLTCLQDVVQDFELPISRKIEILFHLTKNESQMARFFWECFEWDELEPYIVKEECYAE